TSPSTRESSSWSRCEACSGHRAPGRFGGSVVVGLATPPPPRRTQPPQGLPSPSVTGDSCFHARLTRQGSADLGSQLAAAALATLHVPEDVMGVVRVEVVWVRIEYGLLASVDHGLAQTFGEPGFPVRSGVPVSQIRDQE